MAQNAIAHTDTTESHFSLNKRTVLVIEDNDLNREMLCEFISDSYNTIQAENGQVGLELLRRNVHRLSVILLDIQMPVMTGYEFLKEQQADPLLRTIPVLVTTTIESDNEEERCLKLGAMDFVTKPYNPDVVLCRINNIIILRETASTLEAIEHDRLTGLLTKQAFEYHTQEILDANHDQNFDMFYLNLTNFSFINEQYGTAYGDAIIKSVGNEIKRLLGSDRLIGHIGGDTFAFMAISNTIDDSEVVEVLPKAVEALLPSANVRVKLGICKEFSKDFSAATVIDNASYAANSIKSLYEMSFAYFDEDLAYQLTRRRWMELRMQEALENGEFKAYYQPKHDVQTGKIVGAEALVRWISPEHGFISPGDFIPLLESNGFVTDVDAYIWQRTAQNLSNWKAHGVPIVPISINASRLDFNKEDMLEQRMQIIEEAGIDVSFMHLEVTESLFANNTEAIIGKLSSFRSAGIKIELDDFGTGYSSFESLAIMPLDIVKLDMTFMRDLDNPSKVKILSACIRLAKNLGFDTVSEGVETADQLSIIEVLGGDYVQGYYYSKPLPEDEFRAYLLSHE